MRQIPYTIKKISKWSSALLQMHQCREALLAHFSKMIAKHLHGIGIWYCSCSFQFSEGLTIQHLHKHAMHLSPLSCIRITKMVFIGSGETCNEDIYGAWTCITVSPNGCNKCLSFGGNGSLIGGLGSIWDHHLTRLTLQFSQCNCTNFLWRTAPSLIIVPLLAVTQDCSIAHRSRYSSWCHIKPDNLEKLHTKQNQPKTHLILPRVNTTRCCTYSAS